MKEQQTFPFIQNQPNQHNDIEARVNAFKIKMTKNRNRMGSARFGIIRTNDPMPAFHLMQHLDKISSKYH
jgi:cytoplasmic iron level regulating protein YaaA (DUF328/UPF0246 family)